MNAATLNDLNTQAKDIVTEARRSGIEVGLRRMANIVLPAENLLVEIAEPDNEFGYQCPCSRFVDGNCERRGKPDPFATGKVGRESRPCTSPRPTNG